MKLRATRARVRNSLLFIKDIGSSKLPEIDGSGAVWSTPSCTAVSCIPDCDGPTDVILGDGAQAEKIGRVKIFDGTVETPSKVLVVETVLGDKILEHPVEAGVTSIQIWSDGYRDSEKIVIGV